jgi:hypothetical protein
MKSKRAKKSVFKSGSAMPPIHDGPLSAADFDASEWEIMFPRFIEEGLVDGPDQRTNEKFDVFSIVDVWRSFAWILCVT